MELWQLYLLTVFSNVSEALRNLSALSFIVTTCLSVGWFIFRMEDEKIAAPIGQWAKRAGTFLLITIFLSVFTPTERQIYTVLGGYFVTNIKDIEKPPPNAVKAANKFIEDYIAEHESEDKGD